MSNKNAGKEKKEEDEQAISTQSQRPLVPGWERICDACPYKDFHVTFKNSTMLADTLERSKKLITNLREQLIAVTKKLEEKKVKDVDVKAKPEE